VIIKASRKEDTHVEIGGEIEASSKIPCVARVGSHLAARVSSKRTLARCAQTNHKKETNAPQRLQRHRDSLPHLSETEVVADDSI
jgi:hypothetical protein